MFSDMPVVIMFTNLYNALLSFTLHSIVTAAPQLNDWIHHDKNEDCKEVHKKAMRICLAESKVPDYVTLNCGKLNYQNGCEMGMRQVIDIDSKNCLSTKCIPNISITCELCKNGEVPYNGGCHKMGSSNVCVRHGDSIPKRILEADMFGNVRCNCFLSNGFIHFNGDCHSESSFNQCNSVGSSKKQLIR